MEDDDWLLAYVAFKTLVKEANEINDLGKSAATKDSETDQRD